MMTDLKYVDAVQVRTCWEIGRHIVGFEQHGANRAIYGVRPIPRLAETLTAEFGWGFDKRNLNHIRGFYQCFPICNAVRTELRWTHYRALLRVETESVRFWHMNEAASQNWSTRALDRQIGTLYYERLLASGDRQAVQAEAAAKLAPLQRTPREFVRELVMWALAGAGGAGRRISPRLYRFPPLQCRAASADWQTQPSRLTPQRRYRTTYGRRNAVCSGWLTNRNACH